MKATVLQFNPHDEEHVLRAVVAGDHEAKRRLKEIIRREAGRYGGSSPKTRNAAVIVDVWMGVDCHPYHERELFEALMRAVNKTLK